MQPKPTSSSKSRALSLNMTRHQIETQSYKLYNNNAQKLCFRNPSSNGVKDPQFVILSNQLKEKAELTLKNNNKIYHCNQLRHGYIKYIGPIYPPRNRIELTEEDHFFIQHQSKQYQFYDFELLNQHILLQIYQLASQQSPKQHTPQEIQRKIDHYLTELDLQFHSCIYQAYKQQHPQLFQKLVRTLTERVHYNTKKAKQFTTNNSLITQYITFRSRTKDYYWRKKAPPLTIYQNYQLLQSEHQKIQKITMQYAEMSEQHENHKQSVFKSIFDLLIMLRYNQCVPERKFNLNTKTWDLNIIQQQIKSLISYFSHIEQQQQKQKQKIDLNQQFIGRLQQQGTINRLQTQTNSSQSTQKSQVQPNKKKKRRR